MRAMTLPSAHVHSIEARCDKSYGNEETRVVKTRNPLAIIAVIAGVIVLLWAPSIARSGYVITRDPSFFASVRADIGWSVGTFASQGGFSTVGNQGLMYEPFAFIIALMHLFGVGPAAITKIIPTAVTVVAFAGSYLLLEDLGSRTAGCLIGSLFFVFNPWSLDQFGYFYIWTGYCLLPIILVGVRRIIRGDRTPSWFPIAIVFLGGIIAWVITLIAICITVLGFPGVSREFRLRRSFRVLFWYLAAGMYWIPEYVLWSQGRSASSLGYSSAGGVLQSKNPVTDLLRLRDFWWPHLDPTGQTGSLVSGLANTSIYVLIVLALWAVVIKFTRTSKQADVTDHRSGTPNYETIVAALILVGVAMGSGTSGLTGPVYSWIHGVQVVGHSFIASLMRSPANLAAPFVLGVSLAIGMASTKWSPVRRSVGGHGGLSQYRRRVAFAVMLPALVIIGCLPSLLSFWTTYRPINIPGSYAKLGASLSQGTVLELGYWNVGSIDPSDGVWHFTWNSRLAADPTVLAASIPNVSLSPLATRINAFDLRMLNARSSTKSAENIVSISKPLGIKTLVVENDIRQSPAGEQRIQNLLTALQELRLNGRKIGQEIIFTLPGPTRGAFWSNRCQIDPAWTWLGAIHVRCPHSINAKTVPRVVSALSVGGPFVPIGIHLGNVHPVIETLGMEADISGGRSGWIVDPAQILAVFGGVVTMALVASVPLRRIVPSTVRQVRRSKGIDADRQ